MRVKQQVSHNSTGMVTAAVMKVQSTVGHKTHWAKRYKNCLPTFVLSTYSVLIKVHIWKAGLMAPEGCSMNTFIHYLTIIVVLAAYNKVEKSI